MTNSALSVPTFKALSGNIFNADGSTPIYSAGAWDFKNASAISVMQISSTGQVNLVQKCLTVSGNVDSFTGGSRAIFDITSGIARVCAGVVAGSSSSMQLITHKTTGASTSVANTGIEISADGAVTAGPSGFTGTHTFYGNTVQYTNTKAIITTNGTGSSAAVASGRMIGKTIHTQGTNTTQDLLTMGDMTGNRRALIRVRVMMMNAIGSGGNEHIGFAFGSSTGNTVGTMTVTTGSSIASTAVGTLSWSGQTLRYTTNQPGNFTVYSIDVEVVGKDEQAVTFYPNNVSV